MTTNSPYPIELMHSVASRICIFMFANAPFKGHFVQMFKLLSKHDLRLHLRRASKLQRASR